MQISTKELTAELTWIKRFVEKKTTIPVLSCTIVAAKGGALTLMATDLELFGISRVEVPGDKEDWTVCVPTNKLLEYAKKLKDDASVTLTANDHKREYEEECVHCKPSRRQAETAGTEPPACKEPGCKDGQIKRKATETHLTLTHGKDGEVTVHGLDPENFPVVPIIEPDTYLTGLDVAVPRAAVSISAEESRFTLNGAKLLVENGSAKLIATDGHRLGVVDLKAATEVPKIDTIISKDALIEAALMNKGTCFFGMNDQFHMFTTGRRTILARRVTGRFPDWERVLPKVKHTVTFNPGLLDNTLDRVLLFADERSRAIKLTVGAGKMEAFAETLDTGSAKGSVDCEGTNGTTFTCGYSGSYLRDFLALAKKEKGNTAFGYNDEKSAGLFAIPGWVYVVMPMRM